MDITNIIFNIFTIIFSSIGLITSCGILFLIFYYRRQSPITTQILLISNNYIGLIFCCIIVLDFCAHSIHGTTNENISFNDWWCIVQVYLSSVACATIFHSFIIQAFYRLFRVVFYKYKKL